MRLISAALSGEKVWQEHTFWYSYQMFCIIVGEETTCLTPYYKWFIDHGGTGLLGGIFEIKLPYLVGIRSKALFIILSALVLLY